MQLVINLSSVDYEFSHKLYELQRSKFFTRLTQLSVLNESVSREYLEEANAVIAANIFDDTHDYD